MPPCWWWWKEEGGGALSDWRPSSSQDEALSAMGTDGQQILSLAAVHTLYVPSPLPSRRLHRPPLFTSTPTTHTQCHSASFCRFCLSYT